MSEVSEIVANHMRIYHKGQRTLLEILISNGSFTPDQIDIFRELLHIVNYSDSEL